MENDEYLWSEQGRPEIEQVARERFMPLVQNQRISEGPTKKTVWTTSYYYLITQEMGSTTTTWAQVCQ